MKKCYSPVISAGLISALIIVALTSPSASAGLKSLSSICGSMVGGALKVDIRNGCVSSSHRYKGHTIKVAPDQQHATINITGGFQYYPARSKLIKRDCGSGRGIVIALNDISPRRYAVIANGTNRGVFDFTRDKRKICLNTGNRIGNSIAPGINAQKLLVEELPQQRGASVQDVLAPLMRKLAIGSEGHGSLEMSIKTVNPSQGDNQRRAIAKIEAHGFADDSVSGMRYTVSFLYDGTSWRAVGLRREQMCARGSKSGQWTDGKCS